MTLLRIRGLRKQFGSLVAVDDVSMQVAAGELRAIIGPNGAGKTTFFNLISGFFAPTSGTIKLGDEDISALSPEARVARGMARTFQITEIFPELSVADNLRIAVEVAAGYGLRPWLGRGARREIDERVGGLLGLAALTAKRRASSFTSASRTLGSTAA